MPRFPSPHVPWSRQHTLLTPPTHFHPASTPAFGKAHTWINNEARNHPKSGLLHETCKGARSALRKDGVYHNTASLQSTFLWIQSREPTIPRTRSQPLGNIESWAAVRLRLLLVTLQASIRISPHVHGGRRRRVDCNVELS